MAIIAVHSTDKTRFPNLALAKIAGWHLEQGDHVEWFTPLLSAQYKEIYSSNVFTRSPEDAYLPDHAQKGGTGYQAATKLPANIEHICPAYDFFGMDYSMGFLTRGCIRSCDFCVVFTKEGGIKAHADIDEFTRHHRVKLLDNNVLAHPHGLEQIDKMARLGLEVDFTQGLDARLIDDAAAKRLARLKWWGRARLACDTQAMKKPIEKAAKKLRFQGLIPTWLDCYVLVKDDIEEALDRVMFLDALKIYPFAQPFQPSTGEKPNINARRLARFVNNRFYRTNRMSWPEYRADAEARGTI